MTDIRPDDVEGAFDGCDSLRTIAVDEDVVVEFQPRPDVIGAQEAGTTPGDKASDLKQEVYLAQVVSVASIIVSLIVGVSGILVGIAGGALAVIGLAGETLLDAVSSLMVLWRFKKGKRRHYESEEDALRRIEARNLERERKFTLVIGICFVVFAVMLLPLAMYHFHHQWVSEAEEEKAASNSFFVSWPAFIIFAAFAQVKFNLAKKLDSKTLRQDAICTVFGAVLALISGLASSAENLLAGESEDAAAFEYVDPIASALIAVLILCEGSRTVFENALYFQQWSSFA